MSRLLKKLLGGAVFLVAGAPFGVAALSTDNLVGYYTFDNGGADSATWASGGAWEGVLRAQDGVAKYDTAEKMFGSQSLYVSGGGFFSLGNPDKYRFGTGSFTVTYWLYMPAPVSPSTSDPTLIGNKDWSGNGRNKGWAQAISGATLNDDIKANVGTGSSSTPNRADAASIDMDPASQSGGGWTFVAMVVDRSSNLLWNYVADPWVVVSGGDFGADSSTPTSADIAAFAGIDFDAPVGYNINIGQDGDGAGYTSLIANFDDVALWNTALSREELWSIYSRGRGGESLGDILQIPEPGTYALVGMAGGFAALAAFRRKRRVR